LFWIIQLNQFFLSKKYEENFQNYLELYQLFFSQNKRVLSNTLIDELYEESLPKINKNIIKNFLYNLAKDFISKTEIKRDFYNSHELYIQNLSSEEKNIINWYTYTGDVIINNYLRNKLDIDEKVYDNINKILIKTNYKIPNIHLNDRKILIQNFIEYIVVILNNIIFKSPRNKRQFIVYQYSSNDYLSRSDNQWENIGFYSTTMINNFTIEAVNNTHYKSYIIVLIDTPCLIINSISKFPTEYEVLFPSNNCFKTVKFYKQYLCKEINNYLCEDPYYKRIIVYNNYGKC